MKPKAVVRAFFIALLVMASFNRAQSQIPQSVLKPSQSMTVLANGDILLLGGASPSSKPTADAYIVSANNTVKKLAQPMNSARVGHTATVLPDGTVLIIGGVDSKGRLIDAAELFDPVTENFSSLADTRIIPRAYHSATLLTDGKVLIVGGVEAGGQFPDDVQLWDWRSRRALSHHAALLIPREGHTAQLCADGTVLIKGGTNRFGGRVSEDEVLDPATKRFSFASSHGADAPREFAIATSLPEDGATEVSVQDPVAIRFTTLVDGRTATLDNIVLRQTNGPTVAAAVNAAEKGRLVFIVPATPLQPGTAYTVEIKSGLKSDAASLAETVIRFVTEGEPAQTSPIDWVPNATWTDAPAIAKFQQLPALEAGPGITAVSGQVLKLTGWPLEHVTLEMDGKKTHTDSTGRFLLTGITAGHHVLWIDGSSASQLNAEYGSYEVGVTVLAGKTNVLNYTTWMTRLDMAHAVAIQSPTVKENIIISPLLPGLELHLPAHTVITDHNGRAVRQISITPVPLNKPPFPLPAGVDVPIYFTIQPGGGYIKVLGSGSGAKGARLIYPNAFNLPPNTSFEFWNYDADAKGWYVYGDGTVSGDGSRVVPNPGVEIYEFTGAMVTNASAGGGQGKSTGQSVSSNDPVSLATGQFVYTKTDLSLSDVVPISFTRTYISNDSHSRAFGIGASHSYDFFMIGDQNPWTYQELVLPDGSRVRFDRISAGTSYLDAVYAHATSGTAFYGARLTFNSDPVMPGTWVLRLKDGTVMYFPNSSSSTSSFGSTPLQIVDRYGNKTVFTRDGSGHLNKITSPNGRYINVTNDTSGRITQLQDNLGRTVAYTYDAAGRLSTATDANNGVTTYTYDDQNRMLTIKDPRSIVYLTNEYDSAGRVSKQTNADGGVYLYNWTATANTSQTHFYAQSGFTGTGGIGGQLFLHSGCWNGNGLNRTDPNCIEGYMPLIAQVDVTDPRGYIRRVIFNSSGYMTSDTHALGQPEQQTITYSYYSDNLLQSATDALGRKTSFQYDGNANPTQVTFLDGTPNSVTTSYTYSGQFNRLGSATNPLGNTTSYGYDQNGNLTTITDALGHTTAFAYNAAGQVTSATDALNNTAQFGYFGGDLVSVTDPLGNSIGSFYDTAGRVKSVTDSQGHTSKYQYNPLNLVTQSTDAQDNNTTFSYDGNGNLLSLTDALNNITSYQYDNMDRVQTRTDPLLRQESYVYDQNGNLVSATDRKSQVTSLTYDPLNRLKLTGYQTVVSGGVTSYESTIAYTYDAGNRITQVVDSAGGTITEAYDNLDHLTSETTAQGSISNVYDLAGRRTSMAVAGQSQVTYSYDNANRLTQIARGTSTVGFNYDDASRRSTLTLSNGVNMAYTYDNDGRVIGITYKFNTNTLGDLSYSYDSLGRRTLVGGSFAQTGLPGAVTSATYNAANELTNWNGTPISYDLNGNMLSDGTNAFTWNARNQVATLNSVNLQYDGFGRRTKNLQNTTLLFNGANAVQELSGSTVTANILTGGTDEFFQRTDANGTVSPLSDGLGSTIALVNTTGSIVTTYGYDPFGNTAIAGTASNNPSQYTGRENEGNGLYFYRTRLLDTRLNRFISEDPLGFKAGINKYIYTSNNPINFTDPLGTEKQKNAGLGCIPLSTFAAADPSHTVVNGIMLARMGAMGLVGINAFPNALHGTNMQTFGVGVSGGLALGLDAGGFAVGAGGSASVLAVADTLGQTGILITPIQTQVPAILSTHPEMSAGFSGNIGATVFVSPKYVDQLSGPSVGVSGAGGPVAADITSNGLSITYGGGFGARFGASGAFGPSILIPVCSD